MTVLVSVMATAGPSLADLPMEVLETVVVLLDWRALRAMSTVRLLAADNHLSNSCRCRSNSAVFLIQWQKPNAAPWAVKMTSTFLRFLT